MRSIIAPLMFSLACACTQAPKHTAQLNAEPAAPVAAQRDTSAVFTASSELQPSEFDAFSNEPSSDIHEVSPPPAEPLATFSLRSGETPHHFSRWSGIPIEQIMADSGLTLGEAYPVGTEVMLPVSGEALSQVLTARTAHHQKRAEGYLATRGGAAGTDFYTVRTGDSAWTIARSEVGVPVWLLETYNPDVDLNQLRPGQVVMVPVLADVVADLSESLPADPAQAE